MNEDFVRIKTTYETRSDKAIAEIIIDSRGYCVESGFLGFSPHPLKTLREAETLYNIAIERAIYFLRLRDNEVYEVNYD